MLVYDNNQNKLYDVTSDPTEGLKGLDQDDYIEALATLGLEAEVEV